jgi:hypothetical protein
VRKGACFDRVTGSRAYMRLYSLPAAAPVRLSACVRTHTVPVPGPVWDRSGIGVPGVGVRVASRRSRPLLLRSSDGAGSVA